MATADDEDLRLRSAALQNATAILLARQQAEDELVRTKEALRESQERLKAALDAADLVAFRWNAETNLLEWEGHVERLLGRSPGEAASLEALRSVIHPDDRDAVSTGWERSAREGRDFDLQFRIVCPDGSVRWIEGKAKALADGGLVSTYITGTFADRTSQKQHAEVLRESEERLRAVFSQAAVGIALAALDGRLLVVNQKFSDILGYAQDELEQQTFFDITHPDDRAETIAASRQLLAGEIPDFALEKRYLRSDGAIVWSLATVTLLRDAEGRPERFLGVIEDITSRKDAEAALRQETRILELLNGTGKLLASKLDLEQVVQAVTDAATALSGAEFGAFFYGTTDETGDSFMLHALTGAPREALATLGQSWATLFGPAFRGGEAPIRCDDVQQDPRFGTMASHVDMPTGHLPVRSYMTVPVRSRSGEVIGGLLFGHSQATVFTERAERLVVGVAAQAGIAIDNARLFESVQKVAAERDALLDSERAARSAAERLSELKDEFLATLSHELRTPLNAILGWSQVLQAGPKTPVDLARGLETIERNARLQTQLIEDLLDMSRITSGTLRLDVQPLYPAAIIEAAIETVQPAADARAIRIERALDSAAGPLSGDPARLQQVTWNLLSNAIKFTPQGGTVRVHLERVDTHVVMSISDTGVGIKPEFMPYLFERFRQGDASTTRLVGGLGLGLSIVKRLVELHGGRVWLESPGEGQGTTATVRLPLIVVDGSAARERSRGPVTSARAAFVASELAGLTVLVVDDRADARDLVMRVLERCSATVITAATADEALALVEAHKPDVLISDIGMPETDGVELLRRIRALGPDRAGRLPAVALTAFAGPEDRLRALRAGFLVHVSKPVDPSELVAIVASVAGRTRS